MKKNMVRIIPGYGTVHKHVLQDSSLSPMAKLLYSLLCAYTGGSDHCYPSQKTMAEDLGATDRSIRKWMSELIDAGIVIQSKKNISISNVNSYELRIPDNRNHDSASEEGTRNGGSGTPGTVVPTKINKDKTNKTVDSDESTSKPDEVDILLKLWNTTFGENLILSKSEKGHTFGAIKKFGLQTLSGAIKQAKQELEKGGIRYTWGSIIYKSSNISSLSAKYTSQHSNPDVPDKLMAKIMEDLDG